jgi:hypothetical protein
MDVHQTEFLQAVVLAGAVALGMTAWDKGRDTVLADGRPGAETRKDHRADSIVATTGKTRTSAEPRAQR